MFNKVQDKLIGDINRHEAIISELKDFTDKLRREEKPDFVSCEKCGCAILRDNAIKGKAEIRTKQEPVYFVGSHESYKIRDENVDYLFYPYYCKLHAPKGLI